MTNEEIITAVESELKNKTLGVTEQYLEIHNPIYKDGKIAIERIDTQDPKTILAYLPVEGEKFYFTIHIDTATKSVVGFSTEAYVQIYFRAISEILNKEDMASLTTLMPTGGWNKGDPRGTTQHKVSSIEFAVNFEPDSFENKMKKILDFLEQDSEGVLKLVEKAEGYIQVIIDTHNANTMFSGVVILDKKIIKRMDALSLSMSVDLFTAGKSFK